MGRCVVKHVWVRRLVAYLDLLVDVEILRDEDGKFRITRQGGPVLLAPLNPNEISLEQWEIPEVVGCGRCGLTIGEGWGKECVPE